MPVDFTTVTARSKLKVRPDPYWYKLRKSCHLGFRKSSTKTDGLWCARFTDNMGYRTFNYFGALDNVANAERFDLARKLAEEWFHHIDSGGITTPKTIEDACNHYVEYIKNDRNRSPNAHQDISRRFSTYVLNDKKLAKTELQKLTKTMVKDWRLRHAATPIESGRSKGMLRSDATLNRDMTTFRAALNLALDNDWVTNDQAWRSPLKPISKKESPEVESSRELYLDLNERRALINELNRDLAEFAKAMCLLPIRPAALASLRVEDYDKRSDILRVKIDKTGAREIPLPKQTAEFIRSHCRGKMPKANIFSRSDGTAWNKDKWKKQIKSAAKNAGLPPETVIYTLRHSVISDMVSQGAPLLTIAQLAGTSVRMIEKHYGKLLSQTAISALEQLRI